MLQHCGPQHQMEVSTHLQAQIALPASEWVQIPQPGSRRGGEEKNPYPCQEYNPDQQKQVKKLNKSPEIQLSKYEKNKLTTIITKTTQQNVKSEKERESSRVKQ